MSQTKEPVFAILRYDESQGEGAGPEVSVTVKCILRDQEYAEAEVTQLNASNRDRNCRYWLQQTRLISANA
jgi:hypothetical protein